MSATQATPALPFIDLAAQRARLGGAVDRAVASVLERQQFIMGPEVGELEKRLGAFSGAAHVVSCASGTDALLLILMAKGIGPGDAVLLPTFTFAATAEVVALLGATPTFVDINPKTWNIDPAGLTAASAQARAQGLTPRAVVAVDLFGLPADYEEIESFCEADGLWLLCDAAQSFGAVYKRRRVGTIGAATATSFFPAKPLGCYGDGGAVFTDDAELASVMRSLRVHGQGTDKYDNVRIGLNARLDTLQAAVLLEKLAIFPEEILARGRAARRYSEGLADVVATPVMPDDRLCVWAQYTILVDAERRATIVDRLKRDGVPTAIYYPRPLHTQTAYRDFPTAGGAAGLPVSERLATRVLSLPMHPYLESSVQDRIIDAVRRATSDAA